MRSRERLLEVLATVNDTLPEGYALRHIGNRLRCHGTLSYLWVRIAQAIIDNEKFSPHFRELAREAVHYGIEDWPR